MGTKWFLFLNKSVKFFKEKFFIIFEKKDRFFEKKRLSEVLIFSAIFPIIVALFLGVCLYQEKQLDQKMAELEKKVKSLVELRNQEERFIKKYHSSDVEFLQNYVEPIHLLKEEGDLVSKIAKQVVYKPLEERSHFLTDGQNQMKFQMECKRKSNLYNEIEWRLDHPVEVNLKDVLQVISLIEGVKLYQFVPNLLRPQLIIKKFSLVSKNGRADGNFFLDLEVLQRNAYEKN